MNFITLAILVVAICVVAWSLWAKTTRPTSLEAECAQHEHALDTAVTKDQLRAARRAGRSWTPGADSQLGFMLKAVQAAYVDSYIRWYGRAPSNHLPHVVEAHRVASRAAFVGGGVLTILETVFGAMMAISFFNIPAGLAVLLGGSVAIALALASKAVISGVVAFWDAHPSRARAFLLGYTSTLFAFWAMAIGAIYIARTDAFAGGAIVELTFGSGLLGLGIFSPTLAGGLFALGSLYEWSSNLAAETEQLLQLQRRIGGLEQRCLTAAEEEATTTTPKAALRQIGKSEPEASEANEAASRVQPHRLIVPTALLLCALGAMPSRADSLNLFVDVTNSVNQGGRLTAVRWVANHLSTLADIHCIDELNVVPFSDDGWTAPPALSQSFRDMRPPMVEAAGSELNWLRGGEKRRERKLADWKAGERDPALAKAGADILNVVGGYELKDKTCSSIFDTLRRISTTEGVSILVTDGAESCSKQVKPIPAPNLRVRAVVVLVGSTSRKGITLAEEYDRRRAELLKIAPWITVSAPSTLHAGLFDTTAADSSAPAS